MATKKNEKGKGREDEYTTCRLYTPDGEDLSDLATLTGQTVAEVYRDVCAQLVRKKRIEHLEAKLRELKD